jgi:hypothetical protein
MQMNDYSHTPTALTLEKNPAEPTEQQGKWAVNRPYSVEIIQLLHA